ncbi:MAG: hypothetical protein WC674_00605 [Candidatus Krumholzibacteriia bacterium]
MKRYRKWNAPRCSAALALILTMAIAIQVAGCRKSSENEGGAPAMSTDDVIRVMDAHVNDLMAIPGVVGVAVGALDDGRLCIKVLVVKKTSEHRKRVPREIEGYPVVIEESGEIRAMPGDTAR